MNLPGVWYALTPAFLLSVDATGPVYNMYPLLSAIHMPSSAHPASV